MASQANLQTTAAASYPQSGAQSFSTLPAGSFRDIHSPLLAGPSQHPAAQHGGAICAKKRGDGNPACSSKAPSTVALTLLILAFLPSSFSRLVLPSRLLTLQPTRGNVPPATALHRGFMSPALRGRSLGINHRIFRKVIYIYYT